MDQNELYMGRSSGQSSYMVVKVGHTDLRWVGIRFNIRHVCNICDLLITILGRIIDSGKIIPHFHDSYSKVLQFKPKTQPIYLSIFHEDIL